MREPVVGLVVPEQEVDRGNVLDALLAFLQVSLDMLKQKVEIIGAVYKSKVSE